MESGLVAAKVRVQNRAGFVAQSGSSLRQDVDGQLYLAQRRATRTLLSEAWGSGFGKIGFHGD